VTQSTVDKLEEALELAKSGELSSVAIAFVYRDGHSGARWSYAPSLSCLIGAIARLQHEILEFANA
jgi:hypothetical protein